MNGYLLLGMWGLSGIGFIVGYIVGYKQGVKRT